MPCYNEADIIQSNIRETIKTLKNSNYNSFELIIIDDGSSDGTLKEIQAAAQNNDFVKVVQLKKNGGKGLALRQGFQYAGGKCICFLDGDLDIHPRLIQSFMEMMEKENTDVVIGSKRHPLSVVQCPIHRRILSFGYQCFIRMLFFIPIRDSQVGLKLFKRKVLEDVLPRVLGKKYAFDVELLVNTHRKGYTIFEAPIEMNLNTESSNVNIRSFTRMFFDTCAIFYRTNILHYYDTEVENVDKKYQSFVNFMNIPFSFFKR
jgi:glycosyltransferase involved in cell wall biosynthesis